MFYIYIYIYIFIYLYGYTTSCESRFYLHHEIFRFAEFSKSLAISFIVNDLPVMV